MEEWSSKEYPYKKEFDFMVLIYSITLTKEVDFNQVSPSYEVAMEISKGKEKAMVLPIIRIDSAFWKHLLSTGFWICFSVLPQSRLPKK